MPGPQNDSQRSADAQPPEVAPQAPAAADDEVESRPGQGENQAGFLKDVDTPARGSERS